MVSATLSSPAACATPKSSSFTPGSGPPPVSMMFDGFRSRWTMPIACAIRIESAMR